MILLYSRVIRANIRCASLKIEVIVKKQPFSIAQLNGAPHRNVHTSRAHWITLNAGTDIRLERPEPYMAKVNVKKELHNGGDRSCLHLEFDIKGSNIKYEAGDYLVLFPANQPETVKRLVNLCKLTSSDSPEKYQTSLTHYLDITSVPSPSLLNDLANFCTNKSDEDRLKLLSSNTDEGKTLYSSWATEAHPSICDVLKSISSCKPNLANLCKILPKIQRRYYSISSSPKLHPDTVHITAVVINFTTDKGRRNFGLTTSWLENLSVENGRFPSVPIYIAKSKFRLPKEHAKPIIMICQGTGLAPFRSFIQEREFAKRQGVKVGETVLYFGCRRKEQDFLYREELENYDSTGLIKLHTAFSRDQPEKNYVTHILKQNSQNVWDMIHNKNGFVYVCGKADTMALDVKNVILEIIKENGRMTNEQVMMYMKIMTSQNRYATDAWS